jgi:hypothetical protein
MMVTAAPEGPCAQSLLSTAGNRDGVSGPGVGSAWIAWHAALEVGVTGSWMAVACGDAAGAAWPEQAANMTEVKMAK